MAFNLGNAGQIGSAFGGALPDSQLKWLQVQKAKQELAQIEQQLQAKNAQGAAYLQGLPQQGPPPPMPGQPSMPPAPSPMVPPAQGGAVPGAVAGPPAGGGPMAAPAPTASPGAGPSLPSQGTQPGTPSGGAGQPGLAGNVEGAQRLLRELAQTIKAANPGISNAVLAQAVSQQVQQIAPLLQAANQADRLAVQQLITNTKIESAQDLARFKGDLAIMLADKNNAIKIQLGDIRAGTAAAGRAAAMDRTTLVQNREDARQLQRQAFEAQQRAVNVADKERAQQLQTKARQAAQIVSRMNSITAQNASDPQLQTLQAQLDKLNMESDALLAAIGGGSGAPAAKPGASATPGQPATPQSQAEFDALPSGALYVNPSDGKTYRKN